MADRRKRDDERDDRGGRDGKPGNRGRQPYRSDRPPGKGRPPGNRPPGNRPPGNRPPGNRPPGNHPPGSRPYGSRPHGTPYRPSGQSFDRPRDDDRPAREAHGPGDDRPRREGDRRDWRQDRPGNRPDNRRAPGRPYQPRPFPARPYGSRPGYGGPPRPRPAVVDGSEFLGEEDELIAGRRPVEEAFAARREAIRLLVVPERRQALDQLVIHATTLRIPVIELEGGSLTSLAGFDGHQGIALVAKPRPTADVETILASARARTESPFVLVLDSLEDPQNFGTLLRSGEAVGVHGVVYPSHHAAPLTPSAIKASAGATEHLLLAAVDNLPGALADLHARGLRIVAAEEDASLTYEEADLRGPLALVVGSEGRGISAAVRRRLDLSVRIPMRGRVGSLNAAVAGSILLFAAAQQRPAAESTGPSPEVQPTPAPTKPTKPKATPKVKAKALPKATATKPKKTDAKPATRKKSKAAADDELLPAD